MKTIIDELSTNCIKPSKEIDFTNIQKLKEKLTKYNINFVEKRAEDGYQIFFPNSKDWDCCISCHSSSLGGKEGLLEITGLTEEKEGNIVGYLNYENVFMRIKKFLASLGIKIKCVLWHILFLK